MILLDTDHLTVLKYPENPQCARLAARLAASGDQNFSLTIVNAEEQLRGWLAEINRHRTPPQQVFAYEHLGGLLDFLRRFPLIAFDERAADEFERSRQEKVRIGSMDLKSPVSPLSRMRCCSRRTCATSARCRIYRSRTG